MDDILFKDFSNSKIADEHSSCISLFLYVCRIRREQFYSEIYRNHL